MPEADSKLSCGGVSRVGFSRSQSPTLDLIIVILLKIKDKDKESHTRSSSSHSNIPSGFEPPRRMELQIFGKAQTFDRDSTTSRHDYLSLVESISINSTLLI